MCTVLSPIDLAKMDAVVLASLDTTCTIARPTNSTGVWRDNSEAFTTIATNVPCYVAEPSVQQLNAVGGSQIIGTEQLWEVRFRLGTNVLPNDRLTLASGAVMRVQAVLDQISPMRRLLFVSAGAVR